MSWGAHGTIGPADKQYFPGVNTACARSCARHLDLDGAGPGGVAYEEIQHARRAARLHAALGGSVRLSENGSLNRVML
jgi:hypothetical protein